MEDPLPSPPPAYRGRESDTRLHLLVTDLEIGGTPRVVKELAIRLRPLGFDTRVACLSPWGPVADEIAAAGVPVTAMNARGVRDLPKIARRVRQWAKDADVVFSFLVHANAVAAIALLGTETPLVQSIQTTQPRPTWHWWLQGAVGRRARRIVVPSPSVARVAAERSGLGGDRVVVIPNAVDVIPTARPGQEHRPSRIGFIGRLDPVKRVSDLVAATGRLPQMRLDVYGDGPDRPTIEAAILRFGLSGRVTLHGAVTSATGPLAATDVLVLPSEAEGFGLVLIEAMAAGVPVVATDVDGIRDVVTSGVDGLLVPPRDPAAMAAAIERLAGDRTLRGRLVDGGLRTAVDRFAWPTVLGHYAALLQATGRKTRRDSHISADTAWPRR